MSTTSSRASIGFVGVGAAGAALAVELSLRGVSDLAIYDQDASIGTSIAANGGIRYAGLCGTGTTNRMKVSFDLGELIDSASCLVVSVTADRHFELARQMAPHLSAQHLVVLHAGYVAGCRLFQNGLRAGGCNEFPLLAEANSSLHLAAKSDPGSVYIRGRKRWLEVAGLTPSATEQTLSRLGNAMPELSAGRATLESSLNNSNPILHVPAVVGNLGLLGQDLGDATTGVLQFEELRSETVRSLSRTVDQERMKVMRGLGLEPISNDAFLERAYAAGDRLTEQVPRFGTKLLPRFLGEDVAAGFVPIESLGAWRGIQTPVISALITICGSATGVDFRAGGRSVESIGRDWIESECGAPGTRP